MLLSLEEFEVEIDVTPSSAQNSHFKADLVSGNDQLSGNLSAFYGKEQMNTHL